MEKHAKQGYEIYNDGTIFKIPDNAELKPFGKWLQESIENGKPVPSFRPRFNFDNLKRLTKNDFHLLIVRKRGRHFHDGKLNIDKHAHSFCWSHDYDEGANFVVFGDDGEPMCYFTIATPYDDATDNLTFDEMEQFLDEE